MSIDTTTAIVISIIIISLLLLCAIVKRIFSSNILHGGVGEENSPEELASRAFASNHERRYNTLSTALDNIITKNLDELMWLEQSIYSAMNETREYYDRIRNDCMRHELDYTRGITLDRFVKNQSKFSRCAIIRELIQKYDELIRSNKFHNMLKQRAELELSELETVTNPTDNILNKYSFRYLANISSKYPEFAPRVDRVLTKLNIPLMPFTNPIDVSRMPRNPIILPQFTQSSIAHGTMAQSSTSQSLTSQSSTSQSSIAQSQLTFPSTLIPVRSLDEIDIRRVLTTYDNLWLTEDTSIKRSAHQELTRQGISQARRGRLEDNIVTGAGYLQQKCDPATKEPIELRDRTYTRVRNADTDPCMSFAKTLIWAAAQNLKTNGGRICQDLSNVNSALIVGDIHGDLVSLFIILRKYTTLLREDSQACLVFLGDYTDRGVASMDVLYVLSLLKIMYPTRIFLCRGNHESSTMYMYGYHNSVITSLAQRYGNNQYFDAYLAYVIFISTLPFIIRIGGDIFCLHGGVSPRCLTPTNQIDESTPLTFLPVATLGTPLGCLLWSDYPDVERVGDECDSLTPYQFSRFITNNNIRTYIKGHHHLSAAETLDLGSGRSIYILISSLFMTRSTIGEHSKKDTYMEVTGKTAEENTMRTVEKIYPTRESAYRNATYSATVLYINNSAGITRQYPVYDNRYDTTDASIMYGEIQAYYREFFGRQVMTIVENPIEDEQFDDVEGREHSENILVKIEDKLMIDAGIRFDTSLTVASNARCRVIHDLIAVLNAIQGTDHEPPAPYTA